MNAFVLIHFFILVDLSKYFDLQSEFYKLKIKVRSPTGQRLAYNSENQSSFTKLKIIPKEKGKHRISIKLGNHHIKSLALFSLSLNFIKSQFQILFKF